MLHWLVTQAQRRCWFLLLWVWTFYILIILLSLVAFASLCFFVVLNRPLLLQYGLFDQLRVDHGTEFCLCIFVQELLKNRRCDISRAPWRQTTSTKNYRAERLWPEENSRVNYPLKKALCFIKDQEIFNMEGPLVSFAVSWVTLHVSKVGSENFVNSWNYHQIPGDWWYLVTKSCTWSTCWSIFLHAE